MAPRACKLLHSFCVEVTGPACVSVPILIPVRLPLKVPFPANASAEVFFELHYTHDSTSYACTKSFHLISLLLKLFLDLICFGK
jgi:hypothetical protein